MSLPERIFKPLKKIRGGAHLPHKKITAELQTVDFCDVDTVAIALSQHIGAPCESTVKVGDKVFVGTMVGNSDAFVSAPVFSSVSGEVVDIREIGLANGDKTNAVIIKSDGEMTPDENLKPFEVSTPEDLAKAARNCGLVGLGGTGFPTAVKLTVPEGKVIDTLIINAAECEPYIVSDYRECIENSDAIIEGIYLLKDVLKVPNVFLCVEDNKPAAIELLYKAASDERDEKDEIHIMELPSSYPQGAEKVMIYSATGRKLPLGKLPSDVSCIVMNITSVAVLYNYIKTGMPMTSRRVTVSGEGIAEPKNVNVPIGVSIGEIITFCGGLKGENLKVVSGGPMMGAAVCDLTAPLTRQMGAITVYTEKPLDATPCIRCGRCHTACPMNLFPAASERAVKIGTAEALAPLNADYCMSCSSCSFVCPAKRPLAQAMSLAKIKLKELNKK